VARQWLDLLLERGLAREARKHLDFVKNYVNPQAGQSGRNEEN